MIRIRSTGCFAGVLALALTAGPIAGQSAAADPAQPESDTVPEPVKKKGGLFGKVKGLAGNKVVQTVAKTAACTMLPGGQAIAGAIDTASSKSVGEAAAGAAGAAAGTGCLPGMGGAGPVGGMAAPLPRGSRARCPRGMPRTCPPLPRATRVRTAAWRKWRAAWASRPRSSSRWVARPGSGRRWTWRAIGAARCNR